MLKSYCFLNVGDKIIDFFAVVVISNGSIVNECFIHTILQLTSLLRDRKGGGRERERQEGGRERERETGRGEGEREIS